MKRRRNSKFPILLPGIFMLGVGIVFTIQAAQNSLSDALFGVFWTLSLGAILFSAHRSNRSSAQRWDPPEENTRVTKLNGEVIDQGYFCPHCGASVGSDFIYCHKCGNKLP